MTRNPASNPTCQGFDHWLANDGSADLPETWAAHLLECERCARQLEAVQQLDAEIEAACRLFAALPPRPETVPLTIRTQVTTSPHPRRHSGRGILAAASVVAAGILASIWLTERLPQPETSQAIRLLRVESGNEAPLRSAATPEVQIHFEGPALAEPVVSTPRFTFVRVFTVPSAESDSADERTDDFQ